MGHLSRVDIWFNMLFVPGRRMLNLNRRLFFSHIRNLEQAVSTLVNSTAQWNQGSRLGCVPVYLVTQSCLTLCNPIHCSLPGFSVHGLLQARVLEWVAFSSSRGSSWPRDQTQVSCRFFNTDLVECVNFPFEEPWLDLAFFFFSGCILVCLL